MKPITIKSIELHPIALPLVDPLKTSFDDMSEKTAVLVEVTTECGVTGWGEVSVELEPGYGSETMGTALHVLPQFIVPRLIGQTITRGTDTIKLMHPVRGHHHTKAGVEAAVWDAFAKANAMRLADCFATHLPEGHASTGAATVGVSIGIKDSIPETLDLIQTRIDDGYGRIKLKIAPGWDVPLTKAVRERFPDILLMLDANSAYTLENIDVLQQLDAYNLLMIEQPLGDEDIYEHGLLQPQITTPLCLDESVKSAGDLLLALQVGACDILNCKPARVGGYAESLAIYQVCVEHNVPLWIGGMLEVGVGRAANIALASLPGVTMPCDISATARYFDPDITEPPFVLGKNSQIAVPDGPGIGVEVVRERVESANARWKAINTQVEG